MASYEITCSPMAPVGGLAQAPETPEPGQVPEARPRAEGKRQAKLPANVIQAMVALPDLQVRTAAVDPFKPTVVKVRVINTGQVPAAATRVRLWVIPQGKAWYGLVPPLAAGQDAWATVQADLPVMAAQKVYARVDDPDKVKESDEGNNAHVLK